MATPQSRVQKEERAHLLDPDLLIKALNGAYSRNWVHRRAVLVLVRRFQELEKVLRDPRIEFFHQKRSGKIVRPPVVVEKFEAVDRILRRYTATPGIYADFDLDHKSDSRRWQLVWSRAGKKHPFLSVDFVLLIADLASTGRILSVKQCENCRKWLFAGFPHQRFCSEDCKEHFHRFNEADKKRRRDWARKNYQTRKVLEAGSITAASIRRRKVR
jgi:hypothetical protein